MLTYEPGINKYISQRLSEQKDDIVKKNGDFLILLPQFCNDDEKRNLATTLSNKLIRLFNELWDEETSLQSAISALRYILEAQIHSVLLCNEDDYFEKIYYNGIGHKIKKHELLLAQSKKDLALLPKYHEEENKFCFDEVKTEEDAKAILNSQDLIYDKLDEEFSIFLDATEFFGINNQESMIKTKIIPGIENEIKNLEALRRDIYKDLASKTDFNRKFNIRGQTSKIPKVISDKRTWKQKAIDAGLDDEYTFVYDYTSSLLHCTSFSILSNPDIEAPEFTTFRSLSNKLMRNISKNLFTFCRVPSNMAVIKYES